MILADDETEESIKLAEAYEFCREVTKEHAKTFYFAARFLKPRKRNPIYALYALCRLVDDEVDAAEVTDEQAAIQAVERWKRLLDEVYGKFKDQRPKTKDQIQVFAAWENLLKTYNIKQELPLELMRGVLMDTHIKRYETWDALYVYCFRVASTVGLMSAEIFGYDTPETLEYAEALGIAMQLTNILRDVKEDAAMNRIYLPAEDLRRFNVTEAQILANEFDAKFVELIKFEIERARDYYAKAEQGIALLEPDARFTVLLAARIYAKILNEIERQNHNVFIKRAHTTRLQKIAAIPKIWRAAAKM